MTSPRALPLCFQSRLRPGGDFVVPVAHAAADAEAAGTGAEVAPVAQGGDGDADDVGDFTDGEQLVVGVRVLRRRDLLRDGAHADSPCIGADQGFTVGGVGLLSTPNAVHDWVRWPTMRWTITAWCKVRATPRFRLVIMARERYLLRSSRHVPPRGYVGLCAGQATFPRKLWTPPCQGPF